MKGAKGSASRIDRLALRNGPQVTTEHDDGGLRNRSAFSGQKTVFLHLPLRTWDCRPHPSLFVRSLKSAKSAKENNKTYINVCYLSAANDNWFQRNYVCVDAEDNEGVHLCCMNVCSSAKWHVVKIKLNYILLYYIILYYIILYFTNGNLSARIVTRLG